MSILNEAWQRTKAQDSSLDAILGARESPRTVALMAKRVISILLLVLIGGAGGVLIGTVFLHKAPTQARGSESRETKSKTDSYRHKSGANVAKRKVATQNGITKQAKETARSSLRTHDELKLKAADEKPQHHTNNPVSLGEVPEKIRSLFPNITIAVHVWDQHEADRMIMVNGHVYRQGADIGRGVRLVQITRDGEIVSYHGYLIRLPNH